MSRKKRISRMRYLFTEFLWIYFSLIPSCIIISLSLLSKSPSLKSFISINREALIVLMILVFSLYFFKKYIDQIMNNKLKMQCFSNIETLEDDKEYMAFNFFAIYLLPILSINQNNILSSMLVLLIIFIISYKANLFYYNLFIFIFYRYDKVTISNKSFFVISKRGSSSVQENEYMYLIDEKLKLFIRYDDKAQ